MAWTKSRSGQWIHLIPDGAANFVWGTEYPDNPEGIKIIQIQVIFSAVNDKVVIRHGSSTGPITYQYTTLDGSSKAKLFFGGLMKPSIYHADQVYGTPANWRVLIQTTN